MKQRSNMNFTDFRHQFKSFMAENGLPCDEEIIVDGKIHRYSSDANKYKLDEWYIAHEGIANTCVDSNRPYLVATFGSWSQGITLEFKSWEYNKSSGEEIVNFIMSSGAKRQDAYSEISETRDKAAKRANSIWDMSSDSLTEGHLSYFKMKGILPVVGVRYGKNFNGDESIIIPIRNTGDKIRSLQYIWVDETGKSHKQFLFGGEKKGNFFMMGSGYPHSRLIFIVEGYATGSSVYQAINNEYSVVVAFDAGNLESVAENIKNKYPKSIIIIAGDADDIGILKATRAAIKLGCQVTFPKLTYPEKYNDFNDLHKLMGLAEVKKQLFCNTASY